MSFKSYFRRPNDARVSAGIFAVRRLRALQRDVLVGSGVREPRDPAKPRLADARSDPVEKGQLPDRSKDRALVHQLLHLVQDRLPLLVVELNRLLLLKLGVPEAAIEMFGKENKNTWDEATALRNWAKERGVSRIIIPTEIFAARRVRWIFNREFAGSSVRLEIPSFEGPYYTRAEWWKTEAGMITFQNEIMKYLYYRLKY